MKRALSDAAEADVCRRYAAGESAMALGEEYGVLWQRILKILRRRGIPRHPPRLDGQKRQDIIADYTSGKNVRKLAKDHGISATTIYNILDEMGLPVIRPRGPAVILSDDQIAELSRRYRSGESAYLLGKEIGVEPSNLIYHLKKSGVTMRDSYECSRGRLGCVVNEYAFDAESEARNYWVGFLMADGNIFERGSSSIVSLGLAEIDLEHVYRFRDFLGSTHAVHVRTNGRRKDGTMNKIATISIASDILAASLARFGVVPRKSRIAQVIGLETDRHFWRGVIDGDGSVSITPYGGPFIGLTGSRFLVDQFHTYAHQVCPLLKTSPTRDKRTEFLRNYRISYRGAWHLIHELYHDCQIALPRKLENARKILEIHYGSTKKWTPRRDWSHLTHDLLCELRKAHGSWSGVAVHLGMHQTQLVAIRKRIHRATETQRSRETGGNRTTQRQLDLFDLND